MVTILQKGCWGGHSTVLFPFTVITAILLKWSTLDMVGLENIEIAENSAKKFII